MMGRLVLLHTEDAEKKNQIMDLCRTMGIQVKLLGEADLNRSVGALAGIQKSGTFPCQKAPADYRLPEVMVFSGFPDNSLDEFLGTYRSKGIRPIPLKAVLTPYNFNWSLYTLTRELAREHMEMLFGKGVPG